VQAAWVVLIKPTVWERHGRSQLFVVNAGDDPLAAEKAKDRQPGPQEQLRLRRNIDVGQYICGYARLRWTMVTSSFDVRKPGLTSSTDGRTKRNPMTTRCMRPLPARLVRECI
jgi:hypothetical protein